MLHCVRVRALNKGAM